MNVTIHTAASHRDSRLKVAQQCGVGELKKFQIYANVQEQHPVTSVWSQWETEAHKVKSKAGNADHGGFQLPNSPTWTGNQNLNAIWKNDLANVSEYLPNWSRVYVSHVLNTEHARMLRTSEETAGHFKIHTRECGVTVADNRGESFAAQGCIVYARCLHRQNGWSGFWWLQALFWWHFQNLCDYYFGPSNWSFPPTDWMIVSSSWTLHYKPAHHQRESFPSCVTR